MTNTFTNLKVANPQRAVCGAFCNQNHSKPWSTKSNEQTSTNPLKNLSFQPIAMDKDPPKLLKNLGFQLKVMDKDTPKPLNFQDWSNDEMMK